MDKVKIKICGEFAKEDAQRLIKFAERLRSGEFPEVSKKSGFNKRYRL